MLKINRVTITGADDNVEQLDLLKLFDKYPFIEFGILFSKNKQGSQRYPSESWIDHALDLGLNLSAHFCGWYSREVLEHKNYDIISNLDENFKRVQINYNFGASTDWNLSEFFKFVNNDLGFRKSIIFQYNKSNSNYLDDIIDEMPNNIHFLYDSSCGNGKEIECIESPFQFYTGYSGGLNPDNILNVCKLISDKEKSGFNYKDTSIWLDMESGVRTNNEFDLDKVEKVLEIISKFM